MKEILRVSMDTTLPPRISADCSPVFGQNEPGGARLVRADKLGQLWDGKLHGRAGEDKEADVEASTDAGRLLRAG